MVERLQVGPGRRKPGAEKLKKSVRERPGDWGGKPRSEGPASRQQRAGREQACPGPPGQPPEGRAGELGWQQGLRRPSAWGGRPAWPLPLPASRLDGILQIPAQEWTVLEDVAVTQSQQPGVLALGGCRLGASRVSCLLGGGLLDPQPLLLPSAPLLSMGWQVGPHAHLEHLAPWVGSRAPAGPSSSPHPGNPGSASTQAFPDPPQVPCCNSHSSTTSEPRPPQRARLRSLPTALLGTQ